MRLGTTRSKTAFLFSRVGLAGCDMGACAMLPRMIGQGRASELLMTGRAMGGEEGERWGFFNRLCEPDTLLASGTVEPAPTWLQCSGSRWVLRIDEHGVSHASEHLHPVTHDD